jgi:hypothetical protein
MAKNENITPRILSNESDTRYIELSTQFEQDVYWHPSVTITLISIHLLTWMNTRFNVPLCVVGQGITPLPAHLNKGDRYAVR